MKKILDSFFLYLGYISLDEVAKHDDKLTIRLVSGKEFFCQDEPVVDYEYDADLDAFHFRRRFGNETEAIPLQNIAELFVKDFAGNTVIDKPAEK